MVVDERLRKAATEHCRGCATKQKETVESLWDHYALACTLSRGGDPDRSRHWERRAKEHEADLWQIIKRRLW